MIITVDVAAPDREGLVKALREAADIIEDHETFPSETECLHMKRETVHEWKAELVELHSDRLE